MSAKNRRQTKQRSAILEVLNDVDSAITGADLLEDVQILLPSINAATLYRNLHILEEEGVVRRVSVAGKTFFDPKTELHHHFYCHGCERLINVEADAISVPGTDAIMAGQGFVAEHVSFVIEGSCAMCSQEKSTNALCGSCPSLCKNAISSVEVEEVPCSQEAHV